MVFAVGSGLPKSDLEGLLNYDFAAAKMFSFGWTDHTTYKVSRSVGCKSPKLMILVNLNAYQTSSASRNLTIESVHIKPGAIDSSWMFSKSGLIPFMI